MHYNFSFNKTNHDMPIFMLAQAISSYYQKNNTFCVLLCQDAKYAVDMEELLKLLQPSADIFHFVDYEILPYDNFRPFSDIISKRLKVLYKLPKIKKGFLLITANVILQKIIPYRFLHSNIFKLKINDLLNIDQLKYKLDNTMWTKVSTVMTHGEYAIRGSIVDLYPCGSDIPFRIELFDDKIESIRTFDPKSQRTIKKIESINIFPAAEFHLDEKSIAFFRKNFLQHFPNQRDNNIYQKISDGKNPPGIESYLPLFYNDLSTIFDYLPKNYSIFSLVDFINKTEEFYNLCLTRFDHLKSQKKAVLSVDELYINPYKLKNKLQSAFSFTNTEEKNTHIEILEDFVYSKKNKNAIASFLEFVNKFTGKIIVTCQSAGKAKMLYQSLSDYDITSQICKNISQLDNIEAKINLLKLPSSSYNYIIKQINTAIIADNTLTLYKPLQEDEGADTNNNVEAFIDNLANLNIGDPLVHIDYGVGRFAGLGAFLKNSNTEFIKISYANDDILYIPVTKLNLISRFSGISAQNAPLHSLNNNKWQQESKKTKKKIRDTAVALLEINAKRELLSGFSCQFSIKKYQKFSQDFPFVETKDQQRAINDTIKDMQKPHPMDRLICGDVGFGKTEVAMRAVFVCVSSKKQAIILVPTTLLAIQHYESFLDRFANTNMKIALLSRFSSKKEEEIVRKQMITGDVDIVIGTHKLLNKKNKIKNLGLIIIDEEHRFGVRQKEILKTLRLNTDVLTMTATPIPRTLNFSLSGLKELSIIASPPPMRLEIKTFVSCWDDNLIKDAIKREISRGGLVYFLHNNVQTIPKIQRKLQEMLPEIRIDHVHGQMREHQLEQIVADFSMQKFDVLVTTTIIESGIDIPLANTIIINRADKLGLAQLHQIRGRVGRSSHQAYAYLLVPDKQNMTKQGLRRINAIKKTRNLGAGFTLATYDMEIRGAGEILGEEQSGQIQQIGFNLYNEILQQTIKALKEGDGKNFEDFLITQEKTKIDIDMPSFIPEGYIYDINTRLIFYKKIANSKDENTLYDIQVELIDRFGLLPDETKNLFFITNIRILLEKINIKTLHIDDEGGFMIIDKKAKVKIDVIMSLVLKYPDIYLLDKNNKLKFSQNLLTDNDKITFITKLLDKIKS
jgi:transcription-repair coupling factor (superfamily II helicase)